MRSSFLWIGVGGRGGILAGLGVLLATFSNILAGFVVLLASLLIILVGFTHILAS